MRNVLIDKKHNSLIWTSKDSDQILCFIGLDTLPDKVVITDQYLNELEDEEIAQCVDIHQARDNDQGAEFESDLKELNERGGNGQTTV